MQLRPLSFTLDGEAVCSPDRIAIFDALHRRGTVCDAMLYAFDLIELEGRSRRMSLGGPQEAAGQATGEGARRYRTMPRLALPSVRRPRSDPASQCGQTLLRKLKQDGATYQEILDTARKEEAEWYLLKTNLRIEAIAERLGYIDASGFSRAFRRWFGKSPGTFRKSRRGTEVQP
jgi:Helix-turn-helix domain